MAASVTPLTPRAPAGSLPEPRPRRPFRDNPRLILAGIAVLLAALVAILVVSNRAAGLSPDFVSEFVLFALLAADLTMLVALAFVLARNIVKLVVEQRRALPFARFRAKLVGLLLGMTLVPTVLVLIVGSELITSNIDRWFNAPLSDVLSSANQIAADYYRERQLNVGSRASSIAQVFTLSGLDDGAVSRVRQLVESQAASSGHVPVLDIYRATGPSSALENVSTISPGPPPAGYNRAAVDRFAADTFSAGAGAPAVETMGPAGDLLRASALVRRGDGQAIGVVVATDYLDGGLVSRSRRMTQAFESYSQLSVLRRPMTGVYLSLFLMITLFILVGAMWMGLYLAKRITRPVQALAEAAREIGAGRLDKRIEPESGDEFGALTEAFNAMAAELETSRQKVERSTVELERKHLEVETRRRYIETILERITTGVVSVDAAGRLTTINSAAARLLGIDRAVIGQPASRVFARPDLKPLGNLLTGARRPRSEPPPQEVTIGREGQELHLAVVATPLVGCGSGSNSAEGVVLVLDDVTPLIRAQKVAAWREVARRLAHEIKNPLTPIQLSAERMRRHFSDAPSGARALVDECTNTIVGEVESLKGLVDEFSQFARMPSPRTVPTDLHQLIVDTLALYAGIFSDVQIDSQFASDVPLVRLDPEQIRRVIINVVDNAIEAMERRGRIVVETGRDAANSVVRLVVADDGPGIPAAEREKLFLPYYSTKRRGSGLGLAIVRRIIAEHGGSIEVGDNAPRGTRFTIELPC